MKISQEQLQLLHKLYQGIKKPAAEFGINPGSELVRYTIGGDGFIKTFEDLGTKIFTNACGPCMSQWSRLGADKQEKNTIVHSFNRNFSKKEMMEIPIRMLFVAS